MNIDELIFVYVDCPFALIGCLFVAYTLVVLTRLRDTAKIFAYLRFESMFILLDCLITSLLFLYKCRSCFPNLNPFLLCILNYLGFNFLSDMSELASLVMGNLAALACLFMLDTANKTPKFFSILLNIEPYKLAIGVLVLSIINSSYEIFMFKIHSINIDNSTVLFECDDSDFLETTTYKVFALLSFGFNYGIMLVILVILNVLIAVKIKRSLNYRPSALSFLAAKRRRCAEKKLTKLILADCTNLIIGRLPMIIYFIIYNVDLIDYIYASLTILPVLISYIIKFLIFYKFNSRFRNEAKHIFFKIIFFRKYFI